MGLSLQSDEESADEDDLVEYEGMLVSVAAAQRRRCVVGGVRVVVVRVMRMQYCWHCRRP